MRALFIKQDHASPSGLVGEAFTDLGYDVSEFTVVPAGRYHSPDVTVTFPDPAGYDAVVPFGAVWSVYDDTAIGTWIGDEIAFTRHAIRLGVPVLGICFGGQMLAAAVGGQVTRAPEAEIGWNFVDSDIPGLIDPGPWFQWHSDRFTPPAGVPVIARSALADQAFTVGRSLAVQFHPELTPAVLECWLDNGGEAELAAQGASAAELMARTRRLAGACAARTRELVRRFTRQVATAPVALALAADHQRPADIG
ncbi:MAG TPA: gamma-glutamyl-gamma-aminobutyrate hydrolase family protein [Trebonia sp.]|nr:gamma-glutamyl-gamma-aminobutyrate hydrolase family protein [Trebonia sp.]